MCLFHSEALRQRSCSHFYGYFMNNRSKRGILRRLLNQISPEIICDDDTSLTVPQAKFLSKSLKIIYLRKAFHNEGIETYIDVDVLIVNTAILEANQHVSCSRTRRGPLHSYYCTDTEERIVFC